MTDEPNAILDGNNHLVGWRDELPDGQTAEGLIAAHEALDLAAEDDLLKEPPPDSVGDHIEEALLALEAASLLLDDSDPRAAPLGWIVDRLTEMSVIGAELDPWWYESVPKGSGDPDSVTRLSN